MPGQIILAPEYVDVKGPLIFLAGPIQGAPKWRDEASKFIQTAAPELHIASPDGDYQDKKFIFKEQVDWETHYLKRAAKEGVIMFWLAKESEHECDRAYAQTSRFELGEWKIRHERDGTKLVVGIEKGFTNAKYIRRRLFQDCPGVNICDSLKETCLKAIEEARR